MLQLRLLGLATQSVQLGKIVSRIEGIIGVDSMRHTRSAATLQPAPRPVKEMAATSSGANGFSLKTSDKDGFFYEPESSVSQRDTGKRLI